MKTVSVGQRVLARAVQKFGVAETASRLQISAPLLSRLIDGQKPVPDFVLLRAVDLVLDELPGLNPLRHYPQPVSAPVAPTPITKPTNQ